MSKETQSDCKVEFHIDDIRKWIAQTSNEKEAINELIQRIIKVLDNLDAKVGNLMTERQQVVNHLIPFLHIYEVLFEEEAVDKMAKQLLLRGPRRFRRDELSKIVLQLATDLGKQNSQVRDIEVLEALKERAGTAHYALPWKNPRAVVATILKRSGRWKKIGIGKYEPSND